MPACEHVGTVVLDETHGLSTEPARRLQQRARRFSSDTTIVTSDGRSADAKDLLALLLLGVPPGARVTVHCRGPEARAALAEILAAFPGRGVSNGDPIPVTLRPPDAPAQPRRAWVSVVAASLVTTVAWLVGVGVAGREPLALSPLAGLALVGTASLGIGHLDARLQRRPKRDPWHWLAFGILLAATCAWYVHARGAVFFAELALPTLAVALLLLPLWRWSSRRGKVGG